VKEGVARGWVPMIQEKSINPKESVRNILAVVTRNQGGEEKLAKLGITVHPFVSIDEAFLVKYSKNPEVAVEYIRDPTAWSHKYLANNDLTPLVKFFNPDGDKIDKAKNFIKLHGGFMKEAGVFEELDSKVQKEYNARIDEIV
jgi:hypothetical protein